MHITVMDVVFKNLKFILTQLLKKYSLPLLYSPPFKNFWLAIFSRYNPCVYFKCNIFEMMSVIMYTEQDRKLYIHYSLLAPWCKKILQVDRMALESKKYSFENVVEEINFCCAFYSPSPSCRWCRNIASVCKVGRIFLKYRVTQKIVIRQYFTPLLKTSTMTKILVCGVTRQWISTIYDCRILSSTPFLYMQYLLQPLKSKRGSSRKWKISL